MIEGPTQTPLSKSARLKLERVQRREQRNAERLRILERSFKLKRETLELTSTAPAEYPVWGYFKTAAWLHLAASARRALGRPHTQLDQMETLVGHLRTFSQWDIQRCARLVAGEQA